MRTKHELLQVEQERLRNELAILERQWSRKEWLLLFALTAIPAYFFGGTRWALLFLFATPPLLATQAYLLWIRQRECRDLIRQAERDLRKLGAPPAEQKRPPNVAS